MLFGSSVVGGGVCVDEQQKTEPKSESPSSSVEARGYREAKRNGEKKPRGENCPIREDEREGNSIWSTR